MTTTARYTAYRNRATGIWIVRDSWSHKEVAHEPTKASAEAVARSFNKAYDDHIEDEIEDSESMIRAEQANEYALEGVTNF